MVFGVFDYLHPGHRAFLEQAKKYGKKLTVVVARDSSVRKLKKKMPHQTERQRCAALHKIRGVTRVVLGDKELSSYGVVKKYKPEIICLGYDQKWLARDLRTQMRLGKIPRIRIVRLRAYRSKKYHTSLL